MLRQRCIVCNTCCTWLIAAAAQLACQRTIAQAHSWKSDSSLLARSYVKSSVAAAATVLSLCLLWRFLHKQNNLVGYAARPSAAWLQHMGRSEIITPLRRLASLQQAGAVSLRTPKRLSVLRSRPSAAASKAQRGTAAPLARPGAAPLQGPPDIAAPEGQPSPAAPREARRAAAADVDAEEFLAACGFSTADLPGEGVPWHTASSACAVLGRLEQLVLVGDSVTRQVGSACCGVRHPCLACQHDARLLGLCMNRLTEC